MLMGERETGVAVSQNRLFSIFLDREMDSSGIGAPCRMPGVCALLWKCSVVLPFKSMFRVCSCV